MRHPIGCSEVVVAADEHGSCKHVRSVSAKGDCVKKLLLLLGAAIAMSACADSSTAPSAPKVAPADKANLDITCRSGYIVAYDENGNPYCKAE